MRTLSKRATALIFAAALAISGAAASAAAPTAAACSVTDPNCVTVGTGSPGSPGSDGSSEDTGTHSDGSGGEEKPPPPTCRWMAATTQPADREDPRLEGHKVEAGIVQDWVCVTYDLSGAAVSFGPTGRTRFVENGEPPEPAVPSPRVLAVQAAASFRLPDPVWGRFPAFMLQDGRPYTVVNTHMWFWTDSSEWHSFTATARAGANWATVTAKPVALQLVPGDGQGAVECASPGRPFDTARDAYSSSWVPQPEPDGCDYVYRKATSDYPNEMLTATLSIRWELSWTGSGGTSGTLTAKATSTDQTFMVAEAQAVVSG